MIKHHDTSFRRSLAIQYHVLKALIIREILTRWGRRNIGFLWLFVEPMLALGIFALIWGIRGRFDNLAFQAYGMSMLAFILLGYAPYMLWRNAVSLSSNAIRINTALLHHRNLRPLDFYAARIILEIVGVTTSFAVLLSILIFTGLAPPPKDLAILTEGWLLMIWFSIGFGLTMGTLLAQYEVLSALWRAASIGLMLVSGIFFFVAWLPSSAGELILWVPIIHGSEMLKHGYFGELIHTYENSMYLVLWNLILTFFGVMLAKGFGKYVPDRL